MERLGGLQATLVCHANKQFETCTWETPYKSTVRQGHELSTIKMTVSPDYILRLVPSLLTWDIQILLQQVHIYGQMLNLKSCVGHRAKVYRVL